MNDVESTEEVTVRASHLKNQKECNVEEIGEQPENPSTENFILYQCHVMHIKSKLEFDNEVIG